MEKDLEEALSRESEEIERKILACPSLRTLHADEELKEKLYQQIDTMEKVRK